MRGIIKVLLQIPNPLFDLAGITCGHFLVPFWTFFGATLIGKAVVKMHIQKFFVIFAFNEDLITMAVSYLSRLPWVGQAMEAPVRDFLAKQKEKLHRKVGDAAAGAGDVRETRHGLVVSSTSLILSPFSIHRTATSCPGCLRNWCF